MGDRAAELHILVLVINGLQLVGSSAFMGYARPRSGVIILPLISDTVSGLVSSSARIRQPPSFLTS